jgi:hypothetical protein
MRLFKRRKKDMSNSELQDRLKLLLASIYPEIDIRVRPYDDDPGRRAIYFTEKKFQVLYQMQRYHQIIRAIPGDFFEQNLKNTLWFELAPGETVECLKYPDDELIQEITAEVMRCLEHSGFFEELDNRLCPESKEITVEQCQGDFEVSKAVLKQVGFTQEEFFDIFHVLMAQGAYCDCEILYNVAETSRLKGQYWKKRAEQAG